MKYKMQCYTCDECEEGLWEDERVTFDIANYDKVELCKLCAKEYQRTLIPVDLPNYIFLVKRKDGKIEIVEMVDNSVMAETEDVDQYGCYLDTKIHPILRRVLEGDRMELSEIEVVLNSGQAPKYYVVWAGNQLHTYKIFIGSNKERSDLYIDTLQKYITENNLDGEKPFVIPSSSDTERLLDIIANLNNGCGVLSGKIHLMS